MVRAVLDGDEDGFLRIYLKRESDQILGATLVTEHAGETISALTSAIVNGIATPDIPDDASPSSPIPSKRPRPWFSALRVK